jgi:hypothetical protein
VRYATHPERLALCEEVLELGVERDVVRDEVVDPGPERGDRRRRFVAHRHAEGGLLAVVEIGERDADTAERVGDETIAEEGVPQPHLGDEREDAVFADGTESGYLGLDLEAVSGELEAEVPVDVGAERKPVIVVNPGRVVRVTKLQVQITAELIAVLGRDLEG